MALATSLGIFKKGMRSLLVQFHILHLYTVDSKLYYGPAYQYTRSLRFRRMPSSSSDSLCRSLKGHRARSPCKDKNLSN